MTRIVVVDGSDVCRAPIVEFVLRQQLAASSRFDDAEVVSRGIEAPEGGTMCESAAGRLGHTGDAVRFYASHRARTLTFEDIRTAELVLTAERQQRSAVVRMLPGTQSAVFTWKEALVLATVLAERVEAGTTSAPTDIAGLARALHACRGTIPLIEPAVRTGVFHWRRGGEAADPLTVPAGHDGAALHKHVTQESAEVALAFTTQLARLSAERLAEPLPLPLAEPTPRGRWGRRRA